MFRAILICLVIALGAPVHADVPANVARADILTGWREPDGTYIAGLRIVLAPGWKTYWRAPGDAGIPPEFDWSGSSNVLSVAPLWPVPKIFWQNGMRSVGYTDTLVLPLVVTPRAGDQAIGLAGRVDLGVCLDVCVPVSIDLAQDPIEGSALLREALARLPLGATEAGVTKVTCGAEPISDGMRITARVTMPPVGPDEAAVIEPSDPAIWVSEAIVTREGAVLTAVADMVPPTAKPFAIDRSRVRITVIAGGRAVDILGCTGG